MESRAAGESGRHPEGVPGPRAEARAGGAGGESEHKRSSWQPPAGYDPLDRRGWGQTAVSLRALRAAEEERAAKRRLRPHRRKLLAGPIAAGPFGQHVQDAPHGVLHGASLCPPWTRVSAPTILCATRTSVAGNIV